MKSRRMSWWLLSVFTLLICVAGVLAVAAYVYANHDISTKEYIMNRRETGIVLFDRQGRQFFAFEQSHNATFVPLADIPPHVRQAFIAAEDKGFYHHFGLSPTGIVRAVYLDVRLRSLAFGGSTITQQLIKNTYFNPEKSLLRKFQEAALAVKLEQTYSKDEILEMYLNSVYFGEGVFGIENAAQRYFNTSAKDLTVGQASMLAGILPAPSVLSPLSGDRQASGERQRFVLREMVEANFITAEERAAAEQEELAFNDQPDANNIHAPHFALMVRDELRRLYGEEESVRQGLYVYTTLDLGWQLHAEETLKSHVQQLARSGARNGAAVILDPKTGEIRALVGSIDWHADQFGKMNMALAPRQSGSAFKPIVYAAGVERREITAATRFMDVPTTFGKDYKPRNYDGKYRGPVLARFALANSLNIPAVQAAQQIGPASVTEIARRLGISTLTPGASQNLSVALGAEEISLLDLTAAYGALANEGAYNEPRLILSIRDKFDQPVPLPTAKASHRALTTETAYILWSILSDTVARATVFGKSLHVSRPAAVKTGTTQDYRDALTVGYTRNIVVGAWVGNNDRAPMHEVAGALGAAPIWRQLMERVFLDLPSDSFTQPAGVVSARICRSHGLLATSDSGSSTTEYFIRGTEPTRPCPAPSPSPTPEEGEEGEGENEPQEEKKAKPKPPPKKAESDENDDGDG